MTKSKAERQKVALVTGSTSGIGKVIAFSLARQGFSLIINGRRGEEKVRDIISKIEELNRRKDSCLYIRGDISKEAVRARIVNTINETYGYLNILVNNAGITTQGRKDILELRQGDILKVLSVNLVGPFLLTSALSRLMADSEETNYIINISSVSAYTASTNRADYCLSKAGMSMMTRLFAARLAKHNVRVFEIRPGIIRTDMTKAVHERYDRLIGDGLLPISRWGEPEDIASVVVSIAKGYYSYSTGEVINIDGGFHLRRL